MLLIWVVWGGRKGKHVRLPITDKQAAVLELLHRHVEQGGAPPTNREICNAFGWSSTRSARDHLQALARKGYIEISEGRGHRRVRLIDREAPVARVPVIGRIAAGAPVFAEQHAEARIPIPAEWTGDGFCFVLRVTGDSMKNAGILDGDHVVVRREADAADGDIVVATLDGETTLKRLRRRGKRLTLLAENPAYRPIHIRTETGVIQGIVVGLLRAYQAPRWLPNRAA